MKRLFYLMLFLLLPVFAYGQADSNMVEIQGKATLADTDVLIVSGSDTVYYKITYAALKTLLGVIYEAQLVNSAGLHSALSDETGTGVAVFADAPTFVTSITMGSAGLNEAELEILDGATLTTAEINALDGIPGTLTATEIGYSHGVTSAIQTQINTLPTVAEVNTQINTMMDDSLLTATTQAGIPWVHDGNWWENVAWEDSMKARLEAVLVLSNLQGAVVDAQVPNNITLYVTTHSLTTDSTLAAALCYGGVFYVPEAQTITLPAVAIGMSMTFITVGAVEVSIDPNASDLMYLDGTALSDGDKATNTSTAGDIIVFTYYDATGWYASSNSWTDGN